MNYKATRKWAVGSIPVANGPISAISQRNLKRSATSIMADKSKLTHKEFEAITSTDGDPQSMAVIEEVVVTSTGKEGWCGECDTLKIEVAYLKKKSDALEIKVGLIYARDIISEVVAVV